MKRAEISITRMTALGMETFSLTCENIQHCLAAPPGGFQINISSKGFSASTRYEPRVKVKASSILDAMVELLDKLLSKQSNIRFDSINTIFEKAAEVAIDRKITYDYPRFARP